MDEGRKRVLLIAAAILAARRLCQYSPDGGRVSVFRSQSVNFMKCRALRSSVLRIDAGERV